MLQPDLIYADEDRLDDQGQRCDPWFKPGWVQESFWSSPWLNTLSIWRISWLRGRKQPLLPPEPEGRWRWQLLALEKNPKIVHIHLVLAHAGSRQNCSPDPLKQHLDRQGERIKTVHPHPLFSGCFQLQWKLPPRWSCSAIIPTRDRADLLKQCSTSLWKSTEKARNNGLDLEILVVDNGSVEPSTAALIKEWQKRIRVLRCDEPFNWSRLNNLAVKQARGEILLFLNNDIEANEHGWIEAMDAHAFRPIVGAVGAVLLYPHHNSTIQHSGVVMGINGSTEHAYRSLEWDNNVHRGRSQLLTGWGAVTGACLMLRKELLERLGGLDEGFPVEFNDVDLCLRLTRLGNRCLIPENAMLVQHESQSRVADKSLTAQKAWFKVKSRWSDYFASPSPWWPAQSESKCVDGRPIGLEKYLNL